MLLNINRNLFQNFPFHLVTISPWPILVSFSLLSLTMGAVLSMHGYGNFTFLLGVASTGLGMLLWFRDIILEATYLGDHTTQVQKGITIGVILFIVSEVFAFFSVFWAFFHSSLSPSVEIGGVWPPQGIEALSALIDIFSFRNNIDITYLSLFIFTVTSPSNLNCRLFHTASDNNNSKDPIKYDGRFDNDGEVFKEMKANSESAEEVESSTQNTSELPSDGEFTTVSDYLNANFSSFEEAFPNLNKDYNFRKFLDKKTMEDSYKEFLNVDDLSKVSVNELLQKINDNPGNSLIEKTFAIKNLDSSNVNPNEVQQILDKANSEIVEILNPSISQKPSKVFEFSNGQVTLDLNLFKYYLNNTYPLIEANFEKISLTGKVGIFGITNFLLYKGIMRVYDSNHQADLSQVKSERAKVKIIKITKKNRLLFSTLGSLILLTGINSLYFAFKYYNPSTLAIEAKTSSSLSTPDTSSLKKSSFFFLFKNKLNKFLFYLLCFLLYCFLFILGYPYILPVINLFNEFFSNYFIYFNICLAIILKLTIFYYILVLYTINKYSYLNNQPSFNRYIPSFLKKELYNLYEVSHFENKAKEIFIHSFFITLIFLFILDFFYIIFFFILLSIIIN